MLVSAFLWGSLAWDRWRKSRAGNVLLDLGPASGAAINAVFALAFVALGLWMLLHSYRPVWILCDVSVAASRAAHVLSRAQVRRKGMSVGPRYIPWAHINGYLLNDDYDIEGDLAVLSSTSLVMKVRDEWAWLPGLSQITIRFPATQRKAVEQLLAEHVVDKGKDKPVGRLGKLGKGRT